MRNQREMLGKETKWTGEKNYTHKMHNMKETAL